MKKMKTEKKVDEKIVDNNNDVKNNQTFTTKEPEKTKNTTMVEDIKK